MTDRVAVAFGVPWKTPHRLTGQSRPLELESLLFATVAVIVLDVRFAGTGVDRQTAVLGRAVSERPRTAESGGQHAPGGHRGRRSTFRMCPRPNSCETQNSQQNREVHQKQPLRSPPQRGNSYISEPFPGGGDAEQPMSPRPRAWPSYPAASRPVPDAGRGKGHAATRENRPASVWSSSGADSFTGRTKSLAAGPGTVPKTLQEEP